MLIYAMGCFVYGHTGTATSADIGNWSFWRFITGHLSPILWHQDPGIRDNWLSGTSFRSQTLYFHISIAIFSHQPPISNMNQLTPELQHLLKPDSASEALCFEPEAKKPKACQTV